MLAFIFTIVNLLVIINYHKYGPVKVDSKSNFIQALFKKYPEPEIVYGDTDSVFVKFSRALNGELLAGKTALKHCIQCGM